MILSRVTSRVTNISSSAGSSFGFGYAGPSGAQARRGGFIDIDDDSVQTVETVHVERVDDSFDELPPTSPTQSDD